MNGRNSHREHVVADAPNEYSTHYERKRATVFLGAPDRYLHGCNAPLSCVSSKLQVHMRRVGGSGCRLVHRSVDTICLAMDTHEYVDIRSSALWLLPVTFCSRIYVHAYLYI